MKLAFALVSALMAFSTVVCAQSSLVGKYSGSIMTPDSRGREKPHGFMIEITSAENGKLIGSALNTGGHCGGSMPAEGTYEGNNVKISAPGARDIQGCGGGVRFEGVAEGNKLIGKMPFRGAVREITLSK